MTKLEFFAIFTVFSSKILIFTTFAQFFREKLLKIKYLDKVAVFGDELFGMRNEMPKNLLKNSSTNFKEK